MDFKTTFYSCQFAQNWGLTFQLLEGVKEGA
jgi:hypothetical protein